MSNLLFESGGIFTEGIIPINYNPVNNSDNNNRINIQITINERPILVVIDTGCPFNVIDPKFIDESCFTTGISQDFQIRSDKYKGFLIRENISLIAEAGKSCCIEATIFVPDPAQNYSYPSFLGLSTLDKFRWAIDLEGENSKFFFGKYHSDFCL